MKKVISALLLSSMLVTSINATVLVTDDNGMLYKETLKGIESEAEIILHETETPSYWKLPSPSIHSVYTEKARDLVTDAEIYVAPNGNDTSGDGSFDNPYATMDRARKAVSELKTSGETPSDGIVVAFKAGVYPAYSTVNFTSADGGSEDCPIVYTAYGDGEVLFKGSMTLSPDDFTEVTGSESSRLSESAAKDVRVIDLKKYGISSGMLTLNQTGTSSMRGTNVEVSVNRELYTLAQYPNADDGLLYTNGLKSSTPTVYYVTQTDMDRISSWSSQNDIWGVGMMSNEWNEVTSPLTFNKSARTMTWTRASTTGGDKIYYYLFNIFEELDIPGEWYLDRKNCLMYIYPNCDMDTASIELTINMQDRFINLENCDYITFDGLSFTGTRGSGIRGNNCDYLTINDCTLHAVLGQAIQLNNSYHCNVTECELTYIGEKGIEISGGIKNTLTKSYNLVDNNLITHWGLYKRTFTHAISVSGQGITVSHNELADSTSSAAGMQGNLNYFEYNYIHDCTTLASDCSAYYNGSSWTSGRNVLRYNIFANIGSRQRSPAAIYWDDGMAYQSAYCNLIVNVGGHGFSIGGGFGQTVVNNIVLGTRGVACLYDSRPYSGNRHGDSFYTLGNGFLWNLYKKTPYNTTVWRENFPLLAQILQDDTDKYAAHYGFNPSFSLICDNVYCNSTANAGGYGWGPVHYSAVIDNYADTYDNLDKIFVDYENGDYRLLEDSLAFGTVRDFEEIPYHLIGRY